MGFDIDSTVPILKEKNASTQNITDARSPLPPQVQCKELRHILFSLELQNQALYAVATFSHPWWNEKKCNKLKKICWNKNNFKYLRFHCCNHHYYTIFKTSFRTYTIYQGLFFLFMSMKIENRFIGNKIKRRGINIFVIFKWYLIDTVTNYFESTIIYLKEDISLLTFQTIYV